MRKNWRELSKEMIEAEERGLHFSHFFWNNDAWSLFVKYQAKAKKTVCLLSSMHQSPDVDQIMQKKAQIDTLLQQEQSWMACLYTIRTAT